MTTLTKRMAEDLTTYYQELGVRVRYLHSDIDTLERVEILRDLRRAGVRRARRDQPAAGRARFARSLALVAILDADKGLPAFFRLAHFKPPDASRPKCQRARPYVR